MPRLALLALALLFLAAPAGRATPMFMGLGDLPGGDFDSGANAVSADGSVVVGMMISAGGPEAFRWENGTLIGLGDLAGGPFWSTAFAVSADGSVVVGTSRVGDATTEYDAFRWENGVMQSLGGRTASGISPNGELIVGSEDVGGVSVAVLWDPLLGSGPINIRKLLLDNGVTELSGWQLSSATAITDGRVVVGTGIDPDGHAQAFLAVLPTVLPEPRTGLLVVAGLTALAWRRRFRAAGEINRGAGAA
jgi:probable HAF family extracellular repeat protein